MRQLLTPVLQLSERMSMLLALIGSVGVLVMMVHIGADVVMRNLFGRPIVATNEIVSRYYMVAIAFLPLAWVEQRRGMVSVEVIDVMLGPRALRVSDVLVATFAAVVYAVVCWTTWQTAVASFRSGTFVMVLDRAVPVWPTDFLPPVGFGLAALVTAVRALGLLAGSDGAARGAGA
jgi:TRAP-type C4-dicarboxylate transport system permease small subunit